VKAWPAVLLVGALFVAPSGLAERPHGSAHSAAPEILHEPVLERHAEQGILRPVPLSVELFGSVALRARRVLVHYRLWGEPDWTTLELRRQGKKFTGAVPCLEVSTVTGDLKYYIRVHDAEGHVIATGASLAKPYRVTIKHDTMLTPGQARVTKCPDPNDCPAGLLGCPSERVVDIPCSTDHDCEHGMTCSWRGFCERVDRRKNWVSLSVEQGFGIVGASGACSVSSQQNEGYACYRADGQQYNGNPVPTNEPLGVGLAPARVVAGYDRLVFYDTSLGARVGWAFRGEGPTPRGGTPFVPVSIAVRATHWFGSDPLARTGFRPFAFLTGGYGMFDVKASAHVREDPAQTVYQGGNDLEQTFDLWKRAGDGFVGVGFGLSLALSAGTALTAEVAVVDAFPFSAVIVAPSVGLMLGF